MSNDIDSELHQFIDDLTVIYARVILLCKFIAQIYARPQIEFPDLEIGRQALVGHRLTYAGVGQSAYRR